MEQNNNVYRPHSAQSAQFARPQLNTNNKEDGKNSPVFPPYVYEHLPELLKTGCSVFKTTRQRDVFLTSAITILSGCFDTVAGLYDGKMANANLYCMVVAPPASDKGVMNWAKELGMGIHTQLIAENEAALKRFKAEMVQYKSVTKDDKAIHLLPVEPIHKTLYIPANSSSAAIMRHIQQNGGRGIICETEMDTLTNTFKQEWGNFDDLLRKAFHQEAFSYSRKTNNEFVEVLRPKPAVALSGTPGQASRLLVSNENGLFSRFICYCYKTPAVWHSVSPSQNINLDAHFQALSERVYLLYEGFKNKTIEFTLTDDQWKILDELFAEKLTLADENLRSTIIRMGLVVFKIAMVLTSLRYEKQLPAGNKITCDSTDLRIALLLTNVYSEHADLVYRSLLTPTHKGVDISNAKLFNGLPSAASFTRKEAVAVEASLSIAERTVDKYLEQFCQNGMLEQVKYGTYAKV